MLQRKIQFFISLLPIGLGVYDITYQIELCTLRSHNLQIENTLCVYPIQIQMTYGNK